MTSRLTQIDFRSNEGNMKYITKSLLKKIYQPRPKESRKYDFGLLLVIGGSEFYSGSPALSALAAFRAGVDMVRVLAPRRAADIIAGFQPDLAAFPLHGERLNKKHLAELLELTESARIVARGKTAVVIGGGAGRSEETQELIREYLSQIKIPAVIDADAIHALRESPDLIKGKNFLITPHGYEFFVLTGQEVIGLSDQDRVKIVQEQANRLQTTILLKGWTDCISDGNKAAAIRAGCPTMTVGGTGDALAGIAGALLARGCGLFDAGAAAALLNGLAGEAAGEKYDEGMLATDLIEEIPNVLKSVKKGRKS